MPMTADQHPQIPYQILQQMSSEIIMTVLSPILDLDDGAGPGVDGLEAALGDCLEDRVGGEAGRHLRDTARRARL